jgi:hypothetical protein
VPYGSGHIHDTFLVVFEQDGRPVRFVQQRLNTRVFHDPHAVMENVRRVTEHQRVALERAGVADTERRALRLVPARERGFEYVDTEGGFWRTFAFIEGASSQDVIRSPEDARVAAEAFGRFQAMLADLPAPRLAETIPHFHDARARFEALEAAAAHDALDRLDGCRAELDGFRRNEPLLDRLDRLHAEGLLPERIAHNDTKLNNVLTDDRTGEALCVIDLDTVMPGLVLHDFGDLVRTATSPTPEDERDLSRIDVQPAMLAALARGYLDGAGGFLTPAERDELVFSGILVTLVVGMRFLTDHLEGDGYFRAHRPGHNLDRARSQLRLAERILSRRDELEAIVGEASHGPTPPSLFRSP